MLSTTYPNRETKKATRTKSLVVGLSLANAFFLTLITVGGWQVRSGAWLGTVFIALLSVAFAMRVHRWKRGVLPVVASTAVFTAIFAAIAVPGWFERDHTAFSHSLIPEPILGFLTIFLIPLQICLVVAALDGFNQQWQVEIEIRDTND